MDDLDMKDPVDEELEEEDELEGLPEDEELDSEDVDEDEEEDDYSDGDAE